MLPADAEDVWQPMLNGLPTHLVVVLPSLEEAVVDMRSSRADACTDRLPGGVELSLTGPSGGPVVLGSNEVLGTCLSRLRPRATASSREGSTTTSASGGR